MPSKSQHGRRKHSFQGKKKKGKRSPQGIIAQRQADIQINKPATPPRAVTPRASAPTPTPVLTTIRYPYIFTELRRIGVLAGILLVILVVLALVLS